MIIGFTGKMGVGKSTAVQYFKDQGYDPKLIKFAGPLYEMQEMLYSRIESVYKRPENFVKDRKLLQWLGTEWGRGTISNTLWVDLWKDEASWALQAGQFVVCDDVRFDNEAEAIKSLGGEIIEITACTDARAVTKGLTAHPSEAGINEYFINWYIKNTGTIEEFKNSLRNVYEAINQQNTKERNK